MSNTTTPTNKPIVAITGLNGFIAIHVALKFLHEGFDVRGSVRSSSSVEKIKNHPIWKEYVAQGRVQAVVVPDLRGDLTELLDGVEIIVNLAAPVGGGLESWEAYKIPTINGVLSILNQAKKVQSVKAVSLMSSMGAALNLVPHDQTIGKVYTEADWNPYDEEFCKSLDLKTNPYASMFWYCASKKYAEFAIQNWVEENKPSFSVAVLRPPMTYGPLLHLTSPNEFNGLGGSQSGWVSIIKGKESTLPEPEATTYADPRDVAEVCYQAAIRRKTDKYQIASGSYSYQMFANEFRKQRPDLDAYFPLGNPNAPTPKEQNYWIMDVSKSINELGIKYHTLEETTKDTLEYYESVGVFKIPPGSWIKEN